MNTIEDCWDAYKTKQAFPWEVLKAHGELISQLPSEKIKGDVSPLADIRGVIELGEESRILAGVTIEGNVSIGKNCRIGPNCYIRGNTSVGDSCIIGNAVEIKNSMIGDNTSIAHLTYVGDSIIGSDINLGPCTVISNTRSDMQNHTCTIDEVEYDTGTNKFGACVGDGTRTAPHTLIQPASVVPENTWTAPGDLIK